MLTDEHSGGASVVEVDVAEEQVAEVREREPAFCEALFEC
jgi:hypothetical protein